MKIAVLGTGMVGQALAGRLSALDHEVTVGTRDVGGRWPGPSPAISETHPSPSGARRTPTSA